MQRYITCRLYSLTVHVNEFNSLVATDCIIISYLQLVVLVMCIYKVTVAFINFKAKVVLKCVSTMCGVLCVIIAGALRMPVLSVGSLDSQDLVTHIL